MKRYNLKMKPADITSNEPNAAFVIKTLFKKIHRSVLPKLNIHPLNWDDCDDSELRPFLNTFNAPSEWIMDTFPPIQRDDYVFNSTRIARRPN
ncbi:unnamed protein product [Caenorhabditis nigoni]